MEGFGGFHDARGIQSSDRAALSCAIHPEPATRSCVTKLSIGNLPPSHLRAVLHSHGWLYLCPSEELGSGFYYSLTLPDAGACSIAVKPVRGTLSCEADRNPSAVDRAALRLIVRRMLSLDFPLGDFQSACKSRGATTGPVPASGT